MNIFENVQFLNEGIIQSLFKKKNKQNSKKERSDEEINNGEERFKKVLKPYLNKMHQIVKKELRESEYKKEAKCIEIDNINEYEYDLYNPYIDCFCKQICSIDLWDVAPNAREYYSSDCPAAKLFYSISSKLKEYTSSIEDEITLKISDDDGDWDNWSIDVEIKYDDLIN